MTDKILTFLTCNKNDCYTEHNIQRTRFILNYFGFVSKHLDVDFKIEYLIVDWGSDKQLSDYFVSEIKDFKFLKFVNVPTTYTQSFALKFDTSRAINIGLKHATGAHIMVLSPDQFVPIAAFPNLMNLLAAPGEYHLHGKEYKLVPRKFLEWSFNFHETDMSKITRQLNSYNNSMNPFRNHKINVGSGIGGMLLHRAGWDTIGGVRNTKHHNRGQDPMVMIDTSRYFEHIDTSTFGVYLYKLPRGKAGFRAAQVKSAKYKQSISSNERKLDISIDDVNVVDHVSLSNESSHDQRVDKVYLADELPNHGNLISIKNITSLAPMFDLVIKVEDILVVKELVTTIIKNNISEIILDDLQALRFIPILTYYFKDITIKIILPTPSSVCLSTALLSDVLLRHPIRNAHYGNIKILQISDLAYKKIHKSNPYLIVMDSTNVELNDVIQKDFRKNSIHVVRTQNGNYAGIPLFKTSESKYGRVKNGEIAYYTLVISISIIILIRKLKWKAGGIL